MINARAAHSAVYNNSFHETTQKFAEYFLTYNARTEIPKEMLHYNYIHV
jgi:hypothetical protein